MSQANEILNFWFGNSTDADYGKPRKVWFSNEAEFDNEIKTRFLKDYEKAALGYFDGWCIGAKIMFSVNLIARPVSSQYISRNTIRGMQRTGKLYRQHNML